MGQNRRGYVVIALVILMMASVWTMSSSSKPATKLDAWEAMESADDGGIDSANYNPLSGAVTGGILAKSAGKDGTGTVQYETVFPDPDTFTAFRTRAATANPDFQWSSSPRNAPTVISVVMGILPLILLGGLVVYAVRTMGGGKAGGGLLSFGNSNAKRLSKDAPHITFADVAGADEAVSELQEICDFLAEPEKYHALGAKIPTGVLLVGPPGTGKTLLARAVAGEADVPFFTVSGSDFVEMFVGVGSRRIRSTFEQAKSAAPAIIFIDEIDAVGRQRGAGVGGGNDEREQTLNSLLVEMDGFHGESGVIVIAATNRPDVLDPALLRPGRFDRQVVVDLPDLSGRLGILNVHAAGKPMAEGVNLRDTAKSTAGLSGADLANLLNEAALLAAKGGRDSITGEDISAAFERIVAGAERKSRVMNERERRTVAYHEAGHAIVGHLLDETDAIHKVTIIPRGRALGITISLKDEDTFLETRREMLADIGMLLAGRAAEEIACDDISTGAGNDMERATAIAKQMVTRFGMSRELGPMTFGQPQHDVFLGRDLANSPDYGEAVAATIDSEISAIIRDSYMGSKSLLGKHRDRLDTMAGVLLERETLAGEELMALLDGDWEGYCERRGTA